MLMVAGLQRDFKMKMDIKHVPKGWGYEKWIVNCEEYCGKLLFFNKDKRCSWHYHKLKDEVFYVQSGKNNMMWLLIFIGHHRRRYTNICAFTTL